MSISRRNLSLISVLVLVISLHSVSRAGNFSRSESSISRELQNFSSDGCTLFLEGPPGQDLRWTDCCFEHDLRYWFGGPLSDRDQADTRLGACVTARAGQRWGRLVEWGVRWGHRSPIRSKTEWGWGWKPRRDLSPLNTEEKKQIIVGLFHLPLNDEFRQKFMERWLLVSPDQRIENRD